MIVFDWLVFHVLPVCLKFLNVLFQFNTIIVPHSWGIVPNSQSFLAILGGEHDFPLQENSPTSHIRPASISFQQTLSNRWSKFSEFVIEAALLVLDLAEFHCLQMKISESTARQWFCSGIAISWPKLPYIQRYLAFFCLQFVALELDSCVLIFLMLPVSQFPASIDWSQALSPQEWDHGPATCLNPYCQVVKCGQEMSRMSPLQYMFRCVWIALYW